MLFPILSCFIKKYFSLCLLFCVLQAHNSYPFNALPSLPFSEFLYFALWSSFLEVTLLCVHSNFCCFCLHHPLLYLSIYSVPNACSHLVCHSPARMLQGEAKSHAFQISKPEDSISALPVSFSKGSVTQPYLLWTKPSPGELRQPALLTALDSPSPVPAHIGIRFRINPSPQIRFLHFLKTVAHEPFSYYPCFFLVLPFGKLLSSPGPVASVLWTG